MCGDCLREASDARMATLGTSGTSGRKAVLRDLRLRISMFAATWAVVVWVTAAIMPRDGRVAKLIDESVGLRERKLTPDGDAAVSSSCRSGRI